MASIFSPLRFTESAKTGPDKRALLNGIAEDRAGLEKLRQKIRAIRATLLKTKN